MYHHNEKNAILFVEIYRKDGVFYEFFCFRRNEFSFLKNFKTTYLRLLQQLAKEVGFVQRKSKYQAQELIALCVWLSQQVASTPLAQLCSHLEASTGVLMSPEGLN